METQRCVRYSEAFKGQILSEIESGRMTRGEIRRRYGVSLSSIREWMGTHGKTHLLDKVVHVETPEERDRVKGLEKEKQRLESALAQSQLKVLALEEMIRLAERMYKVDIKKNSGFKSSKGSEA